MARCVLLVRDLDGNPNFIEGGTLGLVQQLYPIAGVEVIFGEGVDEGYLLLNRNKEKITTLVIGIMLECGNLFASRVKELSYGRTTGIAFARLAIEIIPSLAVIFITAVTDPEILSEAGKIGAVDTVPISGELEYVPDLFVEAKAKAVKRV